MSGHAYSRAVRAHILTHLAIASKVMKTIHFTDEDEIVINDLLCVFDRSVILTAHENELFQVVITKFKNALQSLEGNGPTALLGIQ